MAPKPEHHHSRRGVRNFLNKNFGADDYDDPYLSKIWYGATTPFHLRADDAFITTFLGCGMIPALTGLAMMVVTDVTMSDVNIDVPHENYETVQMDAFRYNGERVLLQQTEDGSWAIFEDRSVSDYDDQFELIADADDALEMATKYKGYFGDVVTALNGNLDDMPDDVPQILTYEGYSPYYTSDNEAVFLIADNNMQAADAAYVLTASQAQDAYTQWQSVAMNIVADDYAPLDTVVTGDVQPLDENLFPSNFAKWFNLVGGLYGGLIGAGAMIGAAQGTAASRRRYNRDMRYNY